MMSLSLCVGRQPFGFRNVVDSRILSHVAEEHEDFPVLSDEMLVSQHTRG